MSLARQLECDAATVSGEAHGSWPCHLATASTVALTVRVRTELKIGLFLVVVAQAGWQHQLCDYMLQRLHSGFEA